MPLSGLTRDSDVYENTINIDDSLLDNAAKLTAVKEKTSLVRMGLEALIAKGSARRLANLGGTEKRLRAIRDGGLVDDDWMVRSNFLLPTYTNGVRSHTFDEREVLALLILLRPYSVAGAPVKELSDFVTHREKDRGSLKTYVQHVLTYCDAVVAQRAGQVQIGVVHSAATFRDTSAQRSQDSS